MAYGVKCNIRAPHRFMRMGALCWLSLPNPGWGNERFEVTGMSRSGRMVTTWIDARDLTNFRAGWIPDNEYPALRRFPFDSKEAAQEWADAIGATYSLGPVRPHAASFGRQPTGAQKSD